ncbi:hypothetical protein [Novosphingobium sp. Gsoil 351]|uniref:hypothetical protein n=1 Tax=Novosphingobium sp. Gsoil 351 TaxID=2675225 RepID=UPI0012B4B822|nr:hypothetical protein [Novosphingobium sp. Gsoil 351]QGN55528.1 hypothetical protein GKE62_14160 [Novosphingobium sp. Gsoil 351]
MIRSILLAGAALALAASPAMAATTTPTHAAARAVPATPAKPATRAVPAKPAARTASAAKPRGKSGMVTTRLANGKKVTYDCHLAGNRTKAACKGAI